MPTEHALAGTARPVTYTRYNVHLSEAQREAIARIARRRGMKSSEVFRDAVSKYIEAWDRKFASATEPV